MSDDRMTDVEWETLFVRAGELSVDLEAIERELADRRESTDG